MESEWRWNVAEWGMQYLPLRFLARKVGTTDRAVGDYPNPLGGGTEYLLDPTNSGIATALFPLLRAINSPNFPFGHWVEPD